MVKGIGLADRRAINEPALLGVWPGICAGCLVSATSATSLSGGHGLPKVVCGAEEQVRNFFVNLSECVYDDQTTKRPKSCAACGEEQGRFLLDCVE